MKRVFLRLYQLFLDLRIRKKLMLSFSILTLLPVILIATFYLTNSRVILREKFAVYTADILTELGKNIGDTASELDTVFTQLHNSAEVQAALRDFPTEGAEAQEKARQALDQLVQDVYYAHPSVESIYLLPYRASHILSAVPQMTTELTPLQLEEIASGKGEPVFLECSESVVTYGRLMISLETSLPIGYLVINLPETELYNLYGDISLSKNGQVFLTDQSGQILSHPDKTLLGTRADAVYLERLVELRRGGKPETAAAEIDGAVSYLVCREIEGHSWYLFYQIRAQEFEADFMSLVGVLLLVAAAVLVLGLGVSLLLARSFSNPIRRLSETMREVENGNFNIRNVNPARDEIGVLSDQFNAMIEQTNELIRTIYEKELLKQQAELKFLKFQINPHFLYNTLETINWVSRIKGVPEAGEIAKALGDLMREGLREEDFVSVETELKNVESYLLIQKYRYGEKMRVEMRVDPSLLHIRTPKFILQPIIENALVHGIEPRLEGGVIRVLGERDGEDILLTVEDDGVGIPEEIRRQLLEDEPQRPSDSNHTHIGLRNVHKRLRLYFGESYGVTVRSEPGVGTVVSLRIPAADPPAPEPNSQ